MSISDSIKKGLGGFKTFTAADARLLLSNGKKASAKTVQVTLSRMASHGQIYRVTKGIFSLQKNDEVVGFAFSPFYYGCVAALMMRNLIDDQVKMEIVTTRTVKRTVLSIYNGESSVLLHHLPRKYYFGFEDMQYGNMVVPVSNPEKTLIDLFYFRIRLSKTDYAGLLKEVKTSRLNKYLAVYDSHTRTAVTNFVKEYKPVSDSGELENQY